MRPPCDHHYVPAEHEQYELCLECGTYHSLAPVPPDQLYNAAYWSGKHSTLQEQRHNVDVHLENGKTKNQFILERITTPVRLAALEIGCAPGSLLHRLREDAHFRSLIGVEADEVLDAPIREISGHKGFMLYGFFPEATAGLAHGSFDLIVACDVFEHSPKPMEFLDECYRLLTRGGQLLMMLPLASQLEPLDARFFAPDEHVYIHSQGHMRTLVAAAGFFDCILDRWTFGHETVSTKKL